MGDGGGIGAINHLSAMGVINCVNYIDCCAGGHRGVTEGSEVTGGGVTKGSEVTNAAPPPPPSIGPNGK